MTEGLAGMSHYSYLPQSLHIIDIALIVNNARVGAQVAVELSKLRKATPQYDMSTPSKNTYNPVSLHDPITTNKPVSTYK